MIKPLQLNKAFYIPFTRITFIFIFSLIIPSSRPALELRPSLAFAPGRVSAESPNEKSVLSQANMASRLPVRDGVDGHRGSLPAGIHDLDPEVNSDATSAEVVPNKIIQTPLADAGDEDDLVGFTDFVGEVSNGQAGVARGVYVQNVLQLPIVQQPDDNPVYVSNQPGVVTQFRSAAENGIIGLLAHNFLSGELFAQLTIGQEVRIVYGDRLVRYYRVVSVQRFQKLAPADLQSDYLDLSDGHKLTTPQVFKEFYQGSEHVTFQTCLKEAGIWNWGLVFVVATPIDSLR